jgi:hypothetical protein
MKLKYALSLYALLALAGCDLSGPEGPAGQDAGERAFSYTVAASAASKPTANLYAFSAALREALENQAAGATPADPVPVTVRGLYLAHRDELVALYGALTRYVSLDLSGSGGTAFAAVRDPFYPENRAKVVSLKLPASVTLLESGYHRASGEGMGAFRGFSALHSVEMPGLQNIGSYALSNCAALAELTLGTTPPALSYNALAGLPAGATITFKVPAAGIQAYQEWGAALGDVTGNFIPLE